MNLLKDLKLNNNPRISKYLKIVNLITENVANGNIKVDQELPSINKFSKEHKVSRDTVEKAYKVLKERNIITSFRGKGSYVNNCELISKTNVFFLINRLTAYKLEIYNSFIKHIGENYRVNLEVYSCDESRFFSGLKDNINNFGYYIILPQFKTISTTQINLRNESIKLIENIPKEKLVILDNNDLNISGDIIEVFQDFEYDIYEALKCALNKINKYKRLNLVITEQFIYPHLLKIRKGFEKFCNDYKIEKRILNEIEDYKIIEKGDLFISITDDELIKLLNLSKIKGFSLGQDIGVISYNETPFKKLLDIAVITTDFKNIGKIAANMIINNKKGKIKNPFRFIDRSSI